MADEVKQVRNVKMGAISDQREIWGELEHEAMGKRGRQCKGLLKRMSRGCKEAIRWVVLLG
jgi:hypothetical protein